MAEGAPILRIENVTKQFGKLHAVNNVSLDIVDGEFFTIVGPSGSGKTTLLRMLAGLEKPSAGDVLLRGKRVNDVPANKRPTCMVFQSLALFNHRNVGQNIEFSLKMRGVSRAARRKRCVELMDVVRLPQDYYAKGVTKCSGGERQRVALARALASDPDIMFFDEPLSAIDYQLRKLLEVELKDLHRETGKTFVYITHSLEEAMVMSDRIGIMDFGKMIQVGTPYEIYNEPNGKFVAQFMGEVNTVEVERVGEHRVRSISDGIEFSVNREPENFERGFLIIRPEIVKIGRAAEDMPNKVQGTVYNDYSLGSRIQYQVRADSDGYQWLVERLQDEPYEGKLDDTVRIGWRPEDSILVNT